MPVSKNRKKHYEKKKEVRQKLIGKMSNKNIKKIMALQMKEFKKYVERRKQEDLLRSSVEEMGEDLTLDQIKEKINE